MNTGYSQYPPSYQETIAPGAPTGPSQINGPSGFTPSTEFYVGQHTGRHHEDAKFYMDNYQGMCSGN